MTFSRQTLKGFERNGNGSPRVVAALRSNPGLKLANAFGVSLRQANALKEILEAWIGAKWIEDRKNF